MKDTRSRPLLTTQEIEQTFQVLNLSTSMERLRYTSMAEPFWDRQDRSLTLVVVDNANEGEQDHAELE